MTFKWPSPTFLPLPDEYLKGFSALCRHHETMREVLGDFYSERSGEVFGGGGIGGFGGSESGPAASAALSRLTGPTYGLTDIIRAGKSDTGGGARKAAEGELTVEGQQGKNSVIRLGLCFQDGGREIPRLVGSLMKNSISLFSDIAEGGQHIQKNWDTSLHYTRLAGRSRMP